MRTSDVATSENTARLAPRALALTLLAVLVVWFANIQYRNLSDPDEGRYAEISREMLMSGDWVTPALNGFRYFEKPPLQYWATAAAFKMFGTKVWTARLYTTSLSILTVGFVYWLGLTLWGRRAGLIAATILVSNLMWITIGHINTLDMGLAAWLTGALGLFVAAQVRERQWWPFALGSWACVALAILSKGPVAIVLLGLPLFLYTVVERNLSWWRRFSFFSGIALCIAMVAPWFLLVSQRNETFAHFFFIHEHLERYLTTVHRRYEPAWYFVPVLLLGSLPWTWALLRGVPAVWREERGVTAFRPARLLLLYAIGVFLFFSASDSKLPPYIVPIFPPLALVAGRYLSARTSSELAGLLLPSAFVAAVIAASASLGALVPFSPRLAVYAPYARWILLASILLAAGAMLAAFCLRRDRVLAAVGILGAAGLIFGQLVVTGNDTLSERRSAAGLAKAIQPRLTGDTRLYNVDQYPQSLPFYLQRTTTLAVYRGELDMGIGLAPETWLPTIDDFAREWRKPGPAIATIEPRIYPSVAALQLPAEVIHRDAQAIVIAKR